ncbi:MAG: hypothetical protein IH987_05685 [Planctomycetes bacterium]|nr:hypothetical protein [Planctomycetota bacterium]
MDGPGSCHLPSGGSHENLFEIQLVFGELQDADVVLLIHREEYYHPDDESVKGRADLIIAKQRNGPTGNVELQFNRMLTRFNNLDMVPAAYETGGDEVPF